MTKREFDEFMSAFYAAYVNVAKKRELVPVDYGQFKVRMRIWEW